MGNEVLVEYVRYTRWATRTLLDACSMLDEDELRRDLRTAYHSIWGALVHIYQADSVWWNRLHGQPATSLSIFEPGTTLQDLRERWLSTLDEFVCWAEICTKDQWAADLEYRNTRGETFRQPIWQLVLHAVNHATLHRGQILAMFRQIDRVPTGLDLISYFREKQ